ncbi:MAG: serine/threonine-protein kinase [Planctomycetota bacterium]
MQGCPPLEQLERYLSGDGAAPELAQHVASCASCRSLSDRVRANNALLAELRPSAAESEPAPASAALGLEFPGYTILGEIHRGGQGIVYRAVQQRTKRVVALKVLIEGSFASPVKRARFEREAELAAQLKHPHIVTLYDRGVTDDGRPFLAMEFVAGNPLSATPAPLPPERNARLRLFVKICRAVAHAHQRGVIHRDLKPGNIVIDDAHEPHILDFGLARAASPLVHADGAPLTMAGEFAGTLAYASPEQLARDAQLVDTRTDMHALGLILYEMLTGRHARRL